MWSRELKPIKNVPMILISIGLCTLCSIRKFPLILSQEPKLLSERKLPCGVEPTFSIHNITLCKAGSLKWQPKGTEQDCLVWKSSWLHRRKPSDRVPGKESSLSFWKAEINLQFSFCDDRVQQCFWWKAFLCSFQVSLLLSSHNGQKKASPTSLTFPKPHEKHGI